MGRYSTIPTLYDECLTISMTKLKEWGYLKPSMLFGGQLTWKRNGEKTASVGFSLNTLSYYRHIELNYTYNGDPVNYEIPLVTIPSNLGKGHLWFFLCPVTKKRCRKLYQVGGKFLHRTAFRGCFYEKQTYSPRNRRLCRSFETLFGSEKAFEVIYSKYFKKYYAGKPTKRYRKMMAKIIKSNNVDEKEIEAMMYR